MKVHVTQREIERARQEHQFFRAGTAGHFTSAIFQACWCADGYNLAKLTRAFPEAVYAFLEFTEQLHRFDWDITE